MKTKKLNKKLQITKLTVVNLNDNQMGNAVGGIIETYDAVCIALTEGPCTTDGIHYCIPDPNTTV